MSHSLEHCRSNIYSALYLGATKMLGQLNNASFRNRIPSSSFALMHNEIELSMYSVSIVNRVEFVVMQFWLTSKGQTSSRFLTSSCL